MKKARRKYIWLKKVNYKHVVKSHEPIEKANEFSLKLEDIVQEQSKNPKSSGMIVNNK